MTTTDGLAVSPCPLIDSICVVCTAPVCFRRGVARPTLKERAYRWPTVDEEGEVRDLVVERRRDTGKAILRVVARDALALAVTAGVGRLFGAVV